MNSVLQTLEKKFSPKPPLAAEEKICECGSRNFWKPKNQNVWRCATCDPPISRALVDQAIGDDLAEPKRPDFADKVAEGEPLVVVSEYLVTCCRPWCKTCGGWQGRERNWSDGSQSIRCRTCGAELPQWPDDDEDGGE